MMNLLDRCVGYLSPVAQVRREQARHVLRMIQKRQFEGASRGDRFKGWRTIEGWDQGTESVLQTLRSRSRYLATNNPYAKRGIKAIAAHVVGKGIIPQIKSKAHDELLKLWADTTACDHEGRHDLYGLQYLVMKTIVEAGECLVVKRPKRPGASVPVAIEVLEPDFLDGSKTANGSNPVVNGVEYERGQRVAYWLYESHPGERPGTRLKSMRILADDIIHAFEVLRPGQVRGIPWITPVILRLKDFDEFEDARILREKLAAALVGFVQDIESSGEFADQEAKEFSEFRPGTFEILPPGKTITFSNPPAPTGYGEVASKALHAIAAGLEVPYEVLTGDYREVNYSSARLAFLEFYRSIDHWRHHVLIPQVMTRVMDWFMEAAELTGKVTDRHLVTWTPPRRELIDPGKDNAAILSAVRAGFMPLTQAIKEYGADPDEVMNEIAASNKALDRLGLVLDSDPRRSGSATEG